MLNGGGSSALSQRDEGPCAAAAAETIPAALPATPPTVGNAFGDGRSRGGDTDDTAEAYEAEHVHAVYESIAPHFSATRHKPWPLVADFLSAQPAGSVGLDVGCGNGKYLSARDAADDVVLIGCDRSEALVGLARRHAGHEGGSSSSRHREREVLVADSLSLPFRPGAADFAISVAVVHHLSTRQRRIEAVAELLRCVRPQGGSVLLYVWALEQASSRRGWDQGGDQDLLVPWVMKGGQGREQKSKKSKKRPPSKEETASSELGEEKEGPENSGQERHGVVGGGVGDQTFQRYYHLYRQGELEEDVLSAGGKVLRSGYEKDNWWAIAENFTRE